MEQKASQNRHDTLAPFWAGAMALLCLTGVATTWIDLGSFWNGYVLDIAGPAWSYILFRGLFTARADNRWTRFFTPVRTALILLAVSAGIETLQYFQWYDATFDPWDFAAYASLLVPLFLIDSWLTESFSRGPENR